MVSAQDNAGGRQRSNDEYLTAAYVWPSCHADERATSLFWSDGFGGWEVIRKGTPRRTVENVFVDYYCNACFTMFTICEGMLVCTETMSRTEKKRTLKAHEHCWEPNARYLLAYFMFMSIRANLQGTANRWHKIEELAKNTA